MVENGPSTDLLIGITGHDLEGRKRGPGRWVFELCRELDKTMPQTRFVVYSRRPIEMPAQNARWFNRVDPLSMATRLKAPLWVLTRVGALSVRDRVDVLWCTAPIIPIFPSGKGNLRTVVSVHDVRHRVVPSYVSLVGRLFYWITFRKSLRLSDAIVCASEATAERLQKYYSINTPIVAVPNAISNLFKPSDPNIVKEVLNKLGIRPPYILTVAARDKIKNLPTLCAAFRYLRRQGKIENFTLVVAGVDSPKIAPQIGADGRADIVSLGFVDDADLPPLYTGAELFVLPSIYEGFGIPVLEARSCGTRILTTDIPELRATGGTNATYCLPSVSGVAAGILEALAKPRPKPDSPRCSWAMSARRLATVLSQDKSFSELGAPGQCMPVDDI